MYDDKNYEDIARKIRNLGGRFKGRLSDLSLFSVLDYLDHNEPELASQILISYLADEDIAMNQKEYSMLLDIAVELGQDDTKSITYIKKHLVDSH